MTGMGMSVLCDQRALVQDNIFTRVYILSNTFQKIERETQHRVRLKSMLDLDNATNYKRYRTVGILAMKQPACMLELAASSVAMQDFNLTLGMQIRSNARDISGGAWTNNQNATQSLALLFKLLYMRVLLAPKSTSTKARAITVVVKVTEYYQDNHAFERVAKLENGLAGNQMTDTCQKPEPPENGALACDTWAGGKYCVVQCGEGFVIEDSTFDSLLTCSDNSGMFTGIGEDQIVPSCTAESSNPFFNYKIEEYYYFDGNCNESTTEIQEHFIEALLAGLGDICSANVCDIEIVEVICPDSDEARRRRSSDSATVILNVEEADSTNLKTTDVKSVLAACFSHCQGKLNACPPGYFSANGVLPCSPCDTGNFASTFGSVECSVCPGPTTTKPGDGFSGRLTSFNVWDYKPISDDTRNCFSENEGNIFSWKQFADAEGHFAVSISQCDDYDNCQSAPCLNGGTCYDKIESFTCSCMQGFDGVKCEQNIDDCDMNSCQNEATCEDGIDTYICDCGVHYTGEFCEIFVVNGSWSAWGDWGECSVTCGRGQRSRYRQCDNPVPENGGFDCVGENEKVEPCALPDDCIYECNEDPEDPENGAINCSWTSNVTKECFPFCQDGFAFDSDEFLDHIECGPNTGFTWNIRNEDNPKAQIPSCTEAKLAEDNIMRYSGEYEIVNGDSSSADNSSLRPAVKLKVESLVEELDCVVSGTCNVKVPCGSGNYPDDFFCERCPRGTYQDEIGQLDCKPCPDGWTTAGMQTRNISLCNDSFIITGLVVKATCIVEDGQRKSAHIHADTAIPERLGISNMHGVKCIMAKVMLMKMTLLKNQYEGLPDNN
ncbi:NOTCH-like protein [Mya arenaria]|uniref:NOTCH-like protein n=1 Tax=Mya arenaria TaxID=6604 RepID=A0ABY7GC98_MYAAR|nr:NOTCH-like protein [Mya arenaria]